MKKITKKINYYYDEEKEIISFFKPIDDFFEKELGEKYKEIRSPRIELPLKDKVVVVVSVRNNLGNFFYKAFSEFCEKTDQCDGYFTAYNDKLEPIEFMMIVSKENYVRIIKWLEKYSFLLRRLS